MSRKVLQAALLTACFVTPTIAHGQTTLATAYPAILGQGVSNSHAGSTPIYYRVTLAANRSYYAVCWSPFSVDQIVDCNVGWRTSGDVPTGVTAEIEPFNSPFTTYGGDGDSLLPTVAGSYYVRVDNTNVAATTINVMIVENTLFSPWWFVLGAAGYDSYVQIRNSTTSSISVTLRAYSNTGTLVGSDVSSIPGNGVVLVQLSSIAPAGGAGSASITFSGPPGSIVGNITTLSGTTGLSFDAPFTPRMNWGTFGSLQ